MNARFLSGPLGFIRMKKYTKLFVGLIAIALIGFAFYYLAWSFGPGSYARAELYQFNIPEDSLIKIINSVKTENINLTLTKKVNVPNGGQFALEDGRKDNSDHWYSIYFYYPDKNQILHTWTRPKNKNTTTFAYVGLNNGLTLGNWKTINDSFWWWKNKPEVEEFEERILKKIRNKTKPNNG